MNEKVIDSKALAEFFIKNGEKENIISSVFDFFELLVKKDVERCSLKLNSKNKKRLDNIKSFYYRYFGDFAEKVPFFV